MKHTTKSNNTKKRRFVFIITLFPILIIVIYVILFFSSDDLSETELNYSSEESFNMFAIKNYIVGGETGLLLVRESDGKDHYLAGNWETSFVDENDVFLFDPENKTVQFLKDGATITEIGSKIDIDGKLNRIQASPDGKYVFFEYKREDNNKFYYCVSEMVRTDSTPSYCYNYNISNYSGITKWDPNLEHMLLFFFHDEKLNIYNPETDEHPSTVAKEDENFEYYLSVLNSIEDEQKEYLPHFLNFTFLPGQIIRTPISSKLLQISDTTLVQVTDSKLSIINLENMTESPLFEGENLLDHDIEYYKPATGGA